jgi:hypothetical protein
VVGGLGPPSVVACVLFGGVEAPLGASPGAGDAIWDRSDARSGLRVWDAGTAGMKVDPRQRFAPH